MKPVHKFLFQFFAIVTMASVPLVSFAADTTPKVFQPEIPIPGLQNLPDDSSLMAQYIRAVYIFFVWIVGLLAVVMIIYGGIRWVAAAGNAGHIKEARDIVTNAIAGVVLALLSVVILRTINPDLVNLRPLTPKNVDPLALGLGITRTCDKDEMDGPGFLSTSDTKCGQVKKIGEGTTTDARGKKIDEFCISTQCKNDEVCSLGTQKFEGQVYFTPGSGCIKKVVYDPPVKEQNGQRIDVINSVDVKNYQCQDWTGHPGGDYSGVPCLQTPVFWCGEVDWDTISGKTSPDFVSNRCPSQYKDYGCYIIGNSGVEEKKSLNGSSLRYIFPNMSCSPNPPGSTGGGANF